VKSRRFGDPGCHHQSGRTQGGRFGRGACGQAPGQPGTDFPEFYRLPTRTRSMRTVSALAGVVVKELYRRKDFYVLFILTALITVMMWFMNFFHDKSIAGYLKEGCLWLIWISALVIAIVTTARQIPAECEKPQRYSRSWPTCHPEPGRARKIYRVLDRHGYRFGDFLCVFLQSSPERGRINGRW